MSCFGQFTRFTVMFLPNAQKVKDLLKRQNVLVTQSLYGLLTNILILEPKQSIEGYKFLMER